jgi:eukaryotic-like serine/threonine-protein kinase
VPVAVLVENLGRYRIEKELGRGAMGQVFLAYDPQIERRVAIKTIQVFASLPEAERVSARERFLREARSAGKLLHPGIVTIFDVGEADGIPYLAMEYVEGQTLDAFCGEDTLLAVRIVVDLIAAAAEALAFAHERGIVHRDVKPANLMRVGETQVKIMDFGLAKGPAAGLTHDGALLGTPNYMAPEQVRGEALDGRADLFSLAVVLYEMLTGEKPFGGDTVSSVLYRIVNEAPKEPGLHMDRVPSALAEFLDKAMAKNAEDRHADGKVFAAALRQAGAAASGALRMKPGPGASLPAPPTRSPAPATPGAAAVAPKARRGPPPPPARPAGKPQGKGRLLVPYVVVAALVIAAAALGVIVLQGRAGGANAALLEARVRTEPAGLTVLLNGHPLDGPVARFSGEGPFGVLTADQGCREAKHRLDPGDAGTEIVLVLDPLRADVPVDPGVAQASISLNGSDAGPPPVQLDLDLCRVNTISATAAGYTPGSVTIPAGATPLAARTAVAAMKLEHIPMGRLRLPAARVPLRFLVDGKPAAPSRDGLEIAAGTHEVRAINDEHFVEVSATVDVPEGGAITPAFSLPRFARLEVQTFPPNASVFLRKGGADWRPIGETPLRSEVEPGHYALRVRSPLTDETREQEIDLRAGANPPVRVAFGRGGR